MKCLFCGTECQQTEESASDAKSKCINHAPLMVTFVQDCYFVIENGEYKVTIYYDKFFEDYQHRFSLYYKSKRVLSSNTIPAITPVSFEEKIKKLMMFS